MCTLDALSPLDEPPHAHQSAPGGMESSLPMQRSAVNYLAPHVAPRNGVHRRSISDPLEFSGVVFEDNSRGGSDSPKRLRRGSGSGVEIDEDLLAKRVRARSPPAAAPATEPPTPMTPAVDPPTAETKDVECAICCGPMEEPSVGGGCAHHFCYECLESWTKTKPSCPTCRAPVWSISRDAEFASLIGVSCSAGSARASDALSGEGEETVEAGEAKPKGYEQVRRGVRIHAPAGVTIASNANGDCVVTRVVRGNGFDLAGVRVGDVVVAVNGTVVRDHSQCIEFIERRCRVDDCEISYRPMATSLFVRKTSALLSQLPNIVTQVRRRSSLVPRSQTQPSFGPTLEVTAAAPFASN